METLHKIITQATASVTQSLQKGDTDWIRIEGEVMGSVIAQITNANAQAAANAKAANMAPPPKLQPPKYLTFAQIADILNAVMTIRVITDGDNDMELLAVYNGKTYDPDTTILFKAATRLNSNLGRRDLEELVARLLLICEKAEVNKDPNLIAVNNGVFDFRKKVLMKYNEDLVFLSKSRVDFNDHITLKTFPDGWDVESWIKEIAVDGDVAELLWETIGSVLRPYVKWDKSVWLFSTAGSNGKGTFCQLLRNLLGPKACCSIPIEDFNKDYALGPIIGKQAIITDENNVGVYIDKVALMKAVVTGDVITVTRKYMAPVNYRFHGMMIQCLNGYPKVKDKSDSFYRRQIFIPFEKSFKGSADNKAIKDTYLYDKDVLEYVLYRVLMMDYSTLSEPDACKAALTDYKEDNDPVRQFWLEFEDELAWDLVPYKFLFDLYKVWYEQNYPKSQTLSRFSFVSGLRTIIQRESIMWACDDDPKKKFRIGSKMSKPEPIIAEYKLKDWMSKSYNGRDAKKLSTLTASELAASYAGIYRK